MSENILIYVLAALVAILAIWNIRIELRMRSLLAGKNAKSLEDTITHVIKELNTLTKTKNDIVDYLENIEKRMRKTIRGVETIRFNPFKDSGSNQSFATAFVSEEGDGVVISSLYSRDRVSIFAKPVKKLSSEYELTEEEKEVLSKAKQ